MTTNRLPVKRSLLISLTTVAVIALGALALAACSGSGDAVPAGADGSPEGSADAAAGDADLAPADAAPLDGSREASTEAGVDGGHDAAALDASTTTADSGILDANALPDGANLDGAAPCGFLTCSPGCCSSAGVCLPGTATDSCGSSGQTCVDCAQTGQTCQQFSCQ